MTTAGPGDLTHAESGLTRPELEKAFNARKNVHTERSQTGRPLTQLKLEQ
jgi:hypothetical protein